MYVHISINTHKTNEGKIKIIQKKSTNKQTKIKAKKKKTGKNYFIFCCLQSLNMFGLLFLLL